MRESERIGAVIAASGGGPETQGTEVEYAVDGAWHLEPIGLDPLG